MSSPSNSPLELKNYRDLILLDEPFAPRQPRGGNVEPSLNSALFALLSEQREANEEAISMLDFQEKHHLLQHLLTLREPLPYLPEAIHHQIDHLRQFDLSQKQIVDSGSLPTIADIFPESSYPAAEKTALWQGDISSLQIDAIVNAANSQLLGCFQPFHQCIDNVIQTQAGPRMREDCHRIMDAQGHLEGTGWAKVTRAYNLPSRFVIHTVGPVVHGREPTERDKHLLAEAYRSVLNLVNELNRSEIGISSLAFCCISTGVFGFPKFSAAQIAIDTVAEWFQSHPTSPLKAVFNVFTNEDLAIYQEKLK